jgi:hypothetical protein
VVMASKARSCPSGGTKQIPAISLTASTITAGRDGTKERARSVSASRCSKSFFNPTLLLEMAFRQRMHSCWTLSHLASLYNHITSWTFDISIRSECVVECKRTFCSIRWGWSELDLNLRRQSRGPMWADCLSGRFSATPCMCKSYERSSPDCQDRQCNPVVYRIDSDVSARIFNKKMGISIIGV